LRAPALLGSPHVTYLCFEGLLAALQELQLFLHQVVGVHLGLLLFELVELKSERTYGIGVMTVSLPEPQE
jgi:hypothetical protein